MKKHWIAAALMAGAALAHAQTAPAPASPAKKELVAKVLQLQQPAIENMARQIAERPVLQMMQQASQVLQTQVPADKREAIAKSIEADAKKFVEEATPLIRDRAIKLAPSTIGALMEERFTEDELRQLAAWLESPVNKKFQQLGPEMQNSMLQKLVAETAPLVDPKLKALQQKMRSSFGLPAEGAPKAAQPAAPPAKGASK